MIWSSVTQLLALLLDLLTTRRQEERAKDLEIALLRQQLRLLHSAAGAAIGTAPSCASMPPSSTAGSPCSAWPESTSEKS